MTGKPHICFVSPLAYPALFDSSGMESLGGAEIQQVIVAKELVRRNYPITIITFDFHQPESFNVNGIKVVKMHKAGRGVPFFRFFHPNISSLWQAMKKANADIYYQRTAAYITGIVSLFAIYYKKKSIYAGAHNTDFILNKELLSHSAHRMLYRFGLKCSNAVIVQNIEQKKLCWQNYRIDAHLIPNTYPVPGRKKDKGNRDCILWVGTIRYFKRPDLFLDLAKSLPEYRFVMIGGADNSYKSYYEKIKFRANAIVNLDFLGFQPLSETEKKFDDATVFINTSEKEGFPNTFLQSWSRGIPTISFFSPFTDNGVDKPGIYVASTEELKQNILYLMAYPAKRKMIGQKCREYYLTHFSPDVVIPEYEKVINQLACSR